MIRIEFLTGAAAAVASAVLPTSALAALEGRYGGRLGVAAVNTANGERIVHRAQERFPMCSTFKLLAVGAVLSRVDAGTIQLDRHIRYGKADLLEYAPVTSAHVSSGYMRLQALCEAAIEYSDNTAANLLLRTIGGPPSVTAYARSLGDDMTRLDRNEPSLNMAIPGDERDTTTPAAMSTDLQNLLTGTVLSVRARGLLHAWLLACRTGAGDIRAGIPRSWIAGDKTGSGKHATNNDVAVLYPPNQRPVFVAAYYTGSSASYEQRNLVLAQVGRIVSSALV